MEIATNLLALEVGDMTNFLTCFGLYGYAPDSEIKAAIKEMYSGLDEGATKKIAIHFSAAARMGAKAWNMSDYEDRLIVLMGEDNYFDWADENNIL